MNHRTRRHSGTREKKRRGDNVSPRRGLTRRQIASTGYTQYQNVLAAGRYFPGKKDTWFQQWWFYVVATQTSTITGTPHHETAFTLLPGMRCRIPGIAERIGTGYWYFFADVQIPMTGPQAFSYELIFAVLYDY